MVPKIKTDMNISYGKQEDFRLQLLATLEQTKSENTAFRVIDVGGVAGGGWSSSVADMVVDINAEDTDTSLSIDICREQEWNKLLSIVATQGQYDYAICAHTLEDVYNPFTALDMLPRIAKAGVITMPCFKVELSRIENSDWLGYIHHRWIYDQEDGEMLVIPKVSFLESLVKDTVTPDPNQYEIRYEWSETIPYQIFMNNYLGPHIYAVIDEYTKLITSRIA